MVQQYSTGKYRYAIRDVTVEGTYGTGDGNAMKVLWYCGIMGLWG